MNMNDVEPAGGAPPEENRCDVALFAPPKLVVASKFGKKSVNERLYGRYPFGWVGVEVAVRALVRAVRNVKIEPKTITPDVFT